MMDESLYHKGMGGMEFEKRYAEWQGSKFAVSVATGTAALHVALAALGMADPIAEWNEDAIALVDAVTGDLARALLDGSARPEGVVAITYTVKAAGELENTLVIVTSDHGMPFPYVKGKIHEDGFHLPLAMRWGRGIKPGRVVESIADLMAPARAKSRKASKARRA